MAWETETTLIVKMNLPKTKLEKVARAAAALIRKRTADGIDKDGKPFVPYSKEYKESPEFAQAGKSGKVDLKLTGEMMTEFGVLQVQNGRFSLGVEDEEQRAKLHGHITGQEGSGKLPVRNPLGLSKAELASVLRTTGVAKTEEEVDALINSMEVV